VKKNKCDYLEKIKLLNILSFFLVLLYNVKSRISAANGKTNNETTTRALVTRQILQTAAHGIKNAQKVSGRKKADPCTEAPRVDQHYFGRIKECLIQID
tara:strand:- start:362 stop:658 length:297 start_codon:yes stop_codon:yes gene_type:complete